MSFRRVSGAIAVALLLAACGGTGRSGSGPVVSVVPGRAPGTPGTASAAGAPRVVRAAGARSPYLADASGRSLFLRGVAVTGLVRYGPRYDENPPLTAADFREIAALGFDYVRLALSWSSLEPAPGQFSASYLAQISRAVGWAHAAGLDVLVDFHFDRWNRLLAPGNEADGAPDWATVTLGGRSPSACVQSTGAGPCATAAWQSFWSDARVAGHGLQEWYIGALLEVSRALRGDAAVVGLELMNNPSTGSVASPGFEQQQLWPFWTRAVAALRADGEHRPVWLTPNAQTEQTGSATGPLTRFAGDSQLVYAPHDYAGVFSGLPWPLGGRGQLVGWLASAAHAVSAYGTAAAIGEWGTGTGTGSDRWIQDQLDLQDRYRVSSAFWMWKQRPGFYNWPVVQVNGALRTDSRRAQELSEPHPDAVPGVLTTVSFAPGSRAVLRVGVSGSGGTAVLWSGAQVVRGGPSPLSQPLTRALVDGRAVRASLVGRAFTGPGVALRGYLVSVPVPAGRHTVTLES